MTYETEESRLRPVSPNGLLTWHYQPAHEVIVTGGRCAGWIHMSQSENGLVRFDANNDARLLSDLVESGKHTADSRSDREQKTHRQDSQPGEENCAGGHGVSWSA
jgi:hypothetical protein